MNIASPITNTASLYGAFNARWLTPEDVARTFVPIVQYKQLVQTQSSILMGPRGCGKTTLLKMLTPRAQKVWKDERLAHNLALATDWPLPAFTAIYVPSDVRWSYEVLSTENVLTTSDTLSNRVQRTLFSLASLREATSVFEYLLDTDERLNYAVSMELVSQWSETRVVPTLSHLRLRLETHGAAIRSAINKNDRSLLAATVDALPSAFTGQAVDALSNACSVFETVVPTALRPKRWALCFDELEIAAEWLQRELLASLRSIDQRFLLKLTWTPILPELLRSRSETLGRGRANARKSQSAHQKDDFDTIPMWNAHVGTVEARRFCREFTTRIIQDRFPGADISPHALFGRSLFAAEDGDGPETYQEGSEIWNAMRRLAEHDESFKAFLVNRELNPSNPVSDSTKAKDECLRKIKPIVLLRETYLKGGQVRSRKRATVYSGEETIYAMSEGNPRWLAGVVSDLIGAGRVTLPTSKAPAIDPGTQAEVLMAASNRMKSYIRNYPVSGEFSLLGLRSLGDLVDRLGLICQREVLGDRFTDEPVGSFVIDVHVHPLLRAEIERGLMLGAFVYVGRQYEVPTSLSNARLRLSFMLSPTYHLLFRNYRWVSLSTALADSRGRQAVLGLEEGTPNEA